jgi:hypothetical protein
MQSFDPATPLVPTEIEAFRFWRCSPAAGYELRSWNYKNIGIWPTNTHEYILCYPQSPTLRNSYGFWSISHLDYLLPAMSSTGAESEVCIIGKVGLKGQVVECEHGYRAQYARVIGICGIAMPRDPDTTETSRREYGKLSEALAFLELTYPILSVDTPLGFATHVPRVIILKNISTTVPIWKPSRYGATKSWAPNWDKIHELEAP